MIRQDFIDRLLNRADLAGLLSDHNVELRKSGSRLEALCPFHEEKSPSFKVDQNGPEVDHYHCYGCGAHGNALDFLIKSVGMQFVDAVRHLASREGLPVEYEERPEVTNPATVDESERRRRALGALSKASTVFREEFGAGHAEEARAELTRRGIGAETIERYGIGYAPPGWNRLTGDSAFSWGGLLDAGLAARSEPKKRPYDFFRDRIMFPICDRRGSVVAFGGRRLRDDPNSGPKYLNTPETLVYHKGEELFGLYQATEAIRKTGIVIVSEGYFDVVTPAQHGIENCVSTCGTALTDAQRDLLLKISRKVYFCFDGDNAGRKATWRAAEMLIGAVTDEHEVRFCTMPAEQDPDSYVRENGPNAFKSLIDGAPTLAEYLAHVLISLARLNSPEGKAVFIRQAIRYWGKFNAPILAFFFRKHICAAAGISEDEFDTLHERVAQRAA